MTEKPKDLPVGAGRCTAKPIPVMQSDALVVDALLRELGLEKGHRGSER